MMRRLLPLLLLCLLLTGCMPVEPFDPETEGVVDVIVHDVPMYYAVNAEGRWQQTDAFEADALTMYEVDDSCFETYMNIGLDGRGEFVNRLTDVRLRDAEGNTVPPTEMLNRVLQAASWLEHDLWYVRIYRAGEEYFLYVELNVTGSAPCELYWYDQARDGLVRVVRFNGLPIMGLRVRDLSPLASRPLVQPAAETATNKPLKTWRGGFSLVRAEDGVNLVGPGGVVARQVTGYWSSGDAGFETADGYFVLHEDTGEVTAYAVLADVPEAYAEYFAETGFVQMNRFRFLPADPQRALDGLTALFREHRPLCDAAADALQACPEVFAFIRSTERHSVLLPDGKRRTYIRKKGDDRIGNWSWPEGVDYVQGNRTGVPVCLLQDDGFLTAEAWAQVQTLLDTMQPRYIGSEHGAVYLHFALMMDNGRTIPARLYYAPDAGMAEVCAAPWPVWEQMREGWYLAALPDAP